MEYIHLLILFCCRKIPRDLTEASLSGAGLSVIAALSMMFLFGMELSDYLSVSTSTSVIVDQSSDGDFLRIEFNISLKSSAMAMLDDLEPGLEGWVCFPNPHSYPISKLGRGFLARLALGRKSHLELGLDWVGAFGNPNPN
ncbi:Protein disulfide isomerase-like 5-4 [Vitis vinifera]|uniref:Protein disulfide isomerase-like 5-4 n=1 Tax=Vitis vinifera TaxID=29760 RepID=A0A438ISG1_VITVI|nr:Protein disulfide isomerase-like 5-4 [Vitis vinifera]